MFTYDTCCLDLVDLGGASLAGLQVQKHKTEKGFYSVSKIAGPAHDEWPTEFCKARMRYWLCAL